MVTFILPLEAKSNKLNLIGLPSDDLNLKHIY